jgi:hypothetical protein
MRAPRPTLLIYNNDDDCCFRAPLVKPYIFSAVKPFFALLDAGDSFEWYENLDPGDHNYQVDNRIQAYRFFTKHFGLPIAEDEIPVGSEIKSPEELNVGLPKNNLTILGLAKQLVNKLNRTDEDLSGTSELRRTKLRELIRYRKVELNHVWGVNNSKNSGIESESFRFEFSDQLSATGVWLKAFTSVDDAPVTIVLNDAGKKESSGVVSERLNRGEQVLAIDLLFRGDASPSNPSGYTQLLATTGDRSLGIQTSHLIALADWILKKSRRDQVRIESTGIRSQVTAQLAAALHPQKFSSLLIKEGMESLGHLLETPVSYENAPDLFCLDLYAEFDIKSLAQLATPAVVELMTLMNEAKD